MIAKRSIKTIYYVNCWDVNCVFEDKSILILNPVEVVRFSLSLPIGRQSVFHYFLCKRKVTFADSF